MTYHTLAAASASIAARTGIDRHDAAVVLGSGLGKYGADLDRAIAIPYGDITGFPVPKVAGHTGTLYSAPVGSARVLVFSGRVHAYEGWDLADVVVGVRAAVMSGAKTVLLTNAAGAVNPAFSPGDLVVLSDHINLTGRNPLTGANDDRLGPRFPDMSSVYSPALRSVLAGAFAEVGLHHTEGVYAWFSGPSYETPAEVRMARTLGADLVGMSTVPEAIAATHMGARVAAVSLVTNMAAGVADQPLSHNEVTETATAAAADFTRLLDVVLPRLVP